MHAAGFGFASNPTAPRPTGVQDLLRRKLCGFADSSTGHASLPLNGPLSGRSLRHGHCPTPGMRARDTVYVLRSQSQPHRWYTGITSDPIARLEAHNRGDSRHTASGRPWRLVVSMTFDSPEAAAAFELYLKSGSGRAFARRHIRTS